MSRMTAANPPKSGRYVPSPRIGTVYLSGVDRITTSFSSQPAVKASSVYSSSSSAVAANMRPLVAPRYRYVCSRRRLRRRKNTYSMTTLHTLSATIST